MDLYLIGLTIIGIAALGMAWMPAITNKTRISYSIWYVLAGFILYSTMDFFPNPDPIRNETYTLHLTEMVVIVSLMGTGLKIDERFSFKNWTIPFRLIFITMILSIALVTALGIFSLEFDLASALLLGAALAPTDPVLASDVQVGPPGEKVKNNIRFSLTAEAGLNDGMAFPFTWLAIAFALSSSNINQILTQWLFNDLLLKIVIGVASGFILGRLLAWLLFYLPSKNAIAEIRDGFVAISATLCVYGITEMLHGYGFIAVFVTAITLRNSERNHKLHINLHSFTDQIERILLAIVLILFGGSLATGILKGLTWEMVLVGLGFIFFIRPVSGMFALIGTKLHLKERLGISFFGIRGIGSFFYAAFALKQADFKFADKVWTVIAFVVLTSVIIHGCTAAFSMRKLEEEFAEELK